MQPSCAPVRPSLNSLGTRQRPEEPPPSRRAKNSRSYGFTLLEVFIYLPLAATLGVAIVSLLVSSTRTLSEHRIMNQLSERNRASLYRMVDGVRPAMKNTVLNVHEDQFEFTLPSAFDGTNTVPGDTIRYEFRTQGNRGQLVRLNVGTGQETILCGNADVGGSRFTFNGTAVVMTVVNTAALPSGLNHTVSSTVTVKLRN